MGQLSGSPEASQPTTFHRRSLALGGILLLWMTAGAGRLFYLQVVRHTDYLARAQRQQQRTVEVTPKRGIIYDRNFRTLAMTVEVDSVFAVPSEIPSPENTAQLLARVLNIKAADLLERIREGKSFCWVKRRVDGLEAERVRSLNLKGVYFQKENKRFYPKKELAAHVLGYVGIDENGLAGIELEYDKQIRGRPGKLLIQTDARHRWYGRNERPPDAGENVVLTIDEKIQYIVERELDAAIEATHAQAASVIVMDPNTGQVLAMANRPTFNPNTYAQAVPEVFMNRAIAAAYEPGSTFKIITISGALEERLTRPDEAIDCQMGSITIFGHRIRDHHAFGMLTVTDIIAHSSDVGAIKLGLRLGDERMYRYMRQFGFGAPTGIELPGEARGLTRPADRWSKISIGAISMGQEVGVTAMQLLTAVSAIANNGRMPRPRIIRESFHNTPSSSPGLLYAAARSSDDAGIGTQVVSPETAASLRHMMQQVVLSGTGKKAQLNGWTAAGKTGTAQKADPRTGGYSKTDYIASFTGFAPVNNPALAIVVVLDSARGLHQGGQISAPVFKRIAEQVLSYMEVPHDLPLKPEKGQPEVTASQEQETDFAAAEQATVETVGPTGLAETMPAPPADSTVIVDLDGALVVPDFTGKPVRAVAEQAVALGLDVQFIGSGTAQQQTPLAGTRLAPGARIVVKFGR